MSFYVAICTELLDLTFLLDASNSTVSSNWTTLLTFLSEFTNRYIIGPNATQVAFVKFSVPTASGAGVIFYLNQYTDHQSLSTALTSEPYKSGKETSFIDALNKTRTAVYTAQHGARTDQPYGVRKVVIVISDGVTDRSEGITPQIAQFKQSGIYVDGVGVTSQMSDSDLSQSQPKAAVIDSFDHVAKAALIVAQDMEDGPEYFAFQHSHTVDLVDRRCHERAGARGRR